jgi:hypothetical protein
MTSRHWLDLKQQVASNSFPTIRYHGGKDDEGYDIETYLEPGMIAVLTAIEDDQDGTLQLTFDVRAHTEFNKQYETPDYFDQDGHPTLTATQAGYGPDRNNYIETLYIGSQWPIDCLFTVVDTKTTKLFKLYQDDRRDGQTYIEWLEALALSALERDYPPC